MATAVLLNPASTDEAAILSLIDGMANAHHRKDALAIAASYDPHANIFNLAPPLLHHGVDVQEKQAWLNSWNGPIEIQPRDFKVTVSGDTAFCYGYMRMSGTKHGVDRPISFWMRETLCLERQDGAWRVIHEHTSVPFYMDGPPLGAFDLEP